MTNDELQPLCLDPEAKGRGRTERISNKLNFSDSNQYTPLEDSTRDQRLHKNGLVGYSFATSKLKLQNGGFGVLGNSHKPYGNMTGGSFINDTQQKKTSSTVSVALSGNEEVVNNFEHRTEEFCSRSDAKCYNENTSKKNLSDTDSESLIVNSSVTKERNYEIHSNHKEKTSKLIGENISEIIGDKRVRFEVTDSSRVVGIDNEFTRKLGDAENSELLRCSRTQNSNSFSSRTIDSDDDQNLRLNEKLVEKNCRYSKSGGANEEKVDNAFETGEEKECEFGNSIERRKSRDRRQRDVEENNENVEHINRKNEMHLEEDEYKEKGKGRYRDKGDDKVLEKSKEPYHREDRYFESDFDVDRDRENDRDREKADEPGGKGGRDKTREKERVRTCDKDKDRERDRGRDRERDRDKSRDRDINREKDRDRDREQEKDRERKKDRDREKDREREKVREREKDREREKVREREKDRERERERKKNRDTEKERKKDRDTEKERDKHRDRGKDKDRDRDRDRERDRHRERDRDDKERCLDKFRDRTEKSEEGGAEAVKHRCKENEQFSKSDLDLNLRDSKDDTGIDAQSKCEESRNDIDKKKKREKSTDRGDDRSKSAKKTRDEENERQTRTSSVSSKSTVKRSGWDKLDEDPIAATLNFPPAPLMTPYSQTTALLVGNASLGHMSNDHLQAQLCRIYVGSLDYTLNEEDIKAVFQAFGEITVVDMPKEAAGARSKGFCFVEYATKEAAEVALVSMQGFQLKGRTIKVGRPTVTAPALTSPVGNISPSILPMGNVGDLKSVVSSPGSNVPQTAHCLQAGALAAASFLKSRGDMTSSTTAFPLNPSFIVPTPHLIQNTELQACHRIYVGCVPFNFCSDDIRQIFSVFGKIIACQLLPAEPPNDTAHRGYGFIDFETAEQCKLAIDTMNGFEVGGRKLKVNYATIPRSPAMPFPLQ